MELPEFPHYPERSKEGYMLNILALDVRKYAAAVGILGLCALGAAAAVKTPESVIERWPGRPRSEARVLIAKYGEPSNFDDNSLVWYKNGPWQKTVVYRQAPRGILGFHSNDILEQTIAYLVPDGKIPEVKRFDGRIRFDKANGQLSSVSESENLNYLALNLVDEIVTDKRNADEARDFYRKTMRLTESGKTSAYLDGFLFPLPADSMTNPASETTPPIPLEEPYRSEIPRPRR
jgi:hypothetical protein